MILGLDIGSKNCKSNKKIIFDSSVLEGDEISKDGIKLILNNKNFSKNLNINPPSKNSITHFFKYNQMNIHTTKYRNPFIDPDVMIELV